MAADYDKDIRDGLSIQALGEYLVLSDMVARISLDSTSRDVVVWKAASNGEFSVRTASLLATVDRKDGVPAWQDHLEVSCAGETQVLYVP
ncbi:Os10g0204000 [Oryza sativa Japonica Group]|uniref:Os10g0204000 protein n=1 Tax=Oryza sativa subsp. japonica TaxID=39947 RepID=A0A0P0XT06_ORYSJ|nr:Os10g0204000 [Oryza sativa Japonica Group]